MTYATEQEARKRWCPFARVYSLAMDQGCSGGWNRDLPQNPPSPYSPSGTRCIASDCMAWRWGNGHRGPIIEERKVKQGDASSLPQRAGHRWFAGDKNDDGTVNWRLFPMTGYCGLASKPEGE